MLEERRRDLASEGPFAMIARPQAPPLSERLKMIELFRSSCEPTRELWKIKVNAAICESLKKGFTIYQDGHLILTTLGAQTVEDPLQSKRDRSMDL
jgi:hypothetical protein